MKKILLPIDFVTLENKLFETLKEQVDAFGAEVTVLNIMNMSSFIYDPHIILSKEKDFLKKVSEDVVNSVTNELKEKGITQVQSVVLEGNPYAEIIDYADLNEIDLIIMNASSMGADKRHRLGGTASKVAMYSKVPVLLIK